MGPQLAVTGRQGRATSLTPLTCADLAHHCPQPQPAVSRTAPGQAENPAAVTTGTRSDLEF